VVSAFAMHAAMHERSLNDIAAALAKKAGGS
jgi:hypothetical protein